MAIETTTPLSQQSPLVLQGYTWDHYLSLGELFEDSGVRIRFLHDSIEIMPPVSADHESRKIHVSCLVEQWCLEKDITLIGRGSTTLKQENIAGGEPDESYCIGEPKPVPDLAIEIALTSGGLSKRSFYQVYRVPEVWIWRNEKLQVFVLNSQSGEYGEASESEVLPDIPIQAVEQCALLPSINEAVKAFREWAFQ